MHGIGFPELLVILGILFFGMLLIVLPYWRIFRKAGFSPWLGLLMIVPLINLILLFYLAFAEWPALGRENPDDFRNSQ